MRARVCVCACVVTQDLRRRVHDLVRVPVGNRLDLDRAQRRKHRRRDERACVAEVVGRQSGDQESMPNIHTQ